VTATLGPLVVDAVEPRALERFWAATLGGPAQRALLSFRPHRRAKTVKNRVHLDVYVRDVEPLLDLGARVLAEYLPQRCLIWKFVRVDDERVVPNRWQWTVRTDPGVLVDPTGQRIQRQAPNAPKGLSSAVHICRGLTKPNKPVEGIAPHPVVTVGAVGMVGVVHTAGLPA